MATETAQFEKQSLDNANKELERATRAFLEQLAAYEKSGRGLAENMAQYIESHRAWVR